MKKLLLIANCLLFTFLLQAQHDNIPSKVSDFFDAMYAIDTARLNSIIHDDANISTLLVNENLKVYKISSKSDFINAISQMSGIHWEEHLHDIEIQSNGMMATAWVPYSFYIGNRLTHCGVNIFNFIKLKDDNWLISSIMDSRDNSEQCTNDKESINRMLNHWHEAATEASFNKYFSFFSTTAIYIGTDITERWTVQEFKDFAKPYFDRGTAWDFKKTRRTITMAPFSKNLAWFDEDLETWMGPCRGSGVAVLTNTGWKIQHYVLSVAVPNDKIQDYLRVLSEER